MKKSILYIVHQWVDIDVQDSTSIGGTTLHILDLINRIQDSYRCLVLYHANGFYMLAIYEGETPKFYRLNVPVKGNYFNYQDEEYEKMLSQIIDFFHVDLVHIHHLYGHPYNIVKVLKAKKLKPVITLHDFFLLCPRVNMLYKNQDFCDMKKISLCKECLKKEIDITGRKEVVEELLNDASQVIVPNKTVAELYQRVYKNLKYIIIEHGSDLDKKIIQRKKHKKMNIAFVGWLTYLKGRDIARLVIKNMDPKQYHFHLFGIADDPFFNQNTKNYTYHGEYQRKNLTRQLQKNKIDVVCLLTRCPETYCYTLSEVLCAGIPVIGFQIGAIDERITRLQVGWTVPLSEKEVGVINKIEEIHNHPEEYEKCLNKIQKIKLPSIETMVKETIKEYKFKKNPAKKEENIFHFKDLEFVAEELVPHPRKKSKIRQIYQTTKRHVPYVVKRPIYLMTKGIKKRRKK